MAFELDGQQDLGKQVRNAAVRQLDKALKTVRRRPRQRDLQDKTVHSLRKRIKKTRALLRLVRDGLGKKTFARDNKELREATRPLSMVRDATMLIDTLKELQKQHRTIHDDVFEPAISALRLRRDRIRKRFMEKEDVFESAESRLRKIHAHIGDWNLHHGVKKTLRTGLRETYKRCRKAMTKANKSASDKHLHQCRKRAKDLQYQLALLEPLSPNWLKSDGLRAHRLTDALGNDHDLAVLRRHVDVKIRDRIDRQRKDLQASARALGQDLFRHSNDKRLNDLVLQDPV